MLEHLSIPRYSYVTSDALRTVTTRWVQAISRKDSPSRRSRLSWEPSSLGSRWERPASYDRVSPPRRLRQELEAVSCLQRVAEGSSAARALPGHARLRNDAKGRQRWLVLGGQRPLGHPDPNHAVLRSFSAGRHEG